MSAPNNVVTMDSSSLSGGWRISLWERSPATGVARESALLTSDGAIVGTTSPHVVLTGPSASSSATGASASWLARIEDPDHPWSSPTTPNSDSDDLSITVNWFVSGTSTEPVVEVELELAWLTPVSSNYYYVSRYACPVMSPNQLPGNPSGGLYDALVIPHQVGLLVKGPVRDTTTHGPLPDYLHTTDVPYPLDIVAYYDEATTLGMLFSPAGVGTRPRFLKIDSRLSTSTVVGCLQLWFEEIPEDAFDSAGCSDGHVATIELFSGDWWDVASIHKSYSRLESVPASPSRSNHLQTPQAGGRQGHRIDRMDDSELHR